MNDNYTDITIILDKSNSMYPLTSDTIGGFNRFLDEQRKLPGEMKLTLMQFYGRNEYTYKNVDIKYVQNLSKENYSAMGSATALFDAVNKAIDDAGIRFVSMKEKDRPGKVLFLVITDGEDNASLFGAKEVAIAKQKHQEEKYGWDFMFIGANLSEASMQQSYGAFVSQSYSSPCSAANIGQMYNMTSSKIGTMRGLNKAMMSPGEYVINKEQVLNFTQEEKAELTT